MDVDNTYKQKKWTGAVLAVPDQVKHLHENNLVKKERIETGKVGTHCKIKKTPIGEVQRFSAPNCQLFQKSFKISSEKRPKCSIYVQ